MDFRDFCPFMKYFSWWNNFPLFFGRLKKILWYFEYGESNFVSYWHRKDFEKCNQFCRYLRAVLKSYLFLFWSLIFFLPIVWKSLRLTCEGCIHQKASWFYWVLWRRENSQIQSRNCYVWRNRFCLKIWLGSVLFFLPFRKGLEEDECQKSGKLYYPKQVCQDKIWFHGFFVFFKNLFIFLKKWEKIFFFAFFLKNKATKSSKKLGKNYAMDRAKWSCSINTSLCK